MEPRPWCRPCLPCLFSGVSSVVFFWTLRTFQGLAPPCSLQFMASSWGVCAQPGQVTPLLWLTAQLSLWSSVPSCLAVWGHGQTRTSGPTVPLISSLPHISASAQGLVYFICKGPDCKHFRLCGCISLCYSHTHLCPVAQRQNIYR